MTLWYHSNFLRSWLPFVRQLRNCAKNKLANFRFSMQKSGSLLAVAAVALLIPFLLLILLLKRTLFSSDAPHLHRNSIMLRDASVHPNLQPFVDSCARATPQLLIHFDPSSRFSTEFSNPVAGDVDPPALTRVFTTFFKVYLFEPNSDIVTNLSSTGRGRPTDVRNSLTYSQQALRTFYADPSIMVRNYSLGYSHLDRVRGSRYIFHLDSASNSVPRRRDVVAIQRTFEGRCYISVKQFAEQIWHDPVYMVVPYSKRPGRLKWFLNQFDRLRSGNVAVRLILAVCKEMQDDISVANSLVVSMKNSKDVEVISVPGDKTGFFSRAISIREGSAVVPHDSIMFISDVDMYIFPPMFDSCRYNSIQNSQVYFPVFYSLYARSSRIDKDAGYWRDSSHGMSCMYKSDFDAIGAYDHAENMFVGWGGEDIALSQAFLNDTRYEVFRAVEPSLRHKWHAKRCEPFTASYRDCISVTFQQLGTLKTVGKYLLEKDIDAQKLYAGHADDDDTGNKSSRSDDLGPAGDTAQSELDEEKLARRKELLRRNQELREERFQRASELHGGTGT